MVCRPVSSCSVPRGSKPVADLPPAQSSFEQGHVEVTSNEALTPLNWQSVRGVRQHGLQGRTEGQAHDTILEGCGLSRPRFSTWTGIHRTGCKSGLSVFRGTREGRNGLVRG